MSAADETNKNQSPDKTHTSGAAGTQDHKKDSGSERSNEIMMQKLKAEFADKEKQYK